MAVKIVDEERIKRTLDRTDHARLCDKDVKALERVEADIKASIAKLTEYLGIIKVRFRCRPTPTAEAVPSHLQKDNIREFYQRRVKVDSKPHG